MGHHISMHFCKSSQAFHWPARAVLVILLLGTGSISSYAGGASAKWQAVGKDGQVWLREATARVEAREGTFALTDSRYRLRESAEPAHDAFGSDPWRVITATDAKGQMDLRLWVRQNARGDVLVKLGCKNRSDKPIYIRNFVVVDGFRPGVWEGGGALNLGVHLTNPQGCSLNPSADGVSPLRDGIEVGGVLATATNRPAFTSGFVATSHYRGLVYVRPVAGGVRVTALNPADEVRLAAGAARESEPVWMSAGPHPSKELERFGDLAGRWNHVRIFPRTFATWCSWYSGMNDWRVKVNNDLLERFILANLPGLSKKYLPLGLECTRVVNDTQGRIPGDFPMVPRQVPGGYPALTKAMRQYGFRPGFHSDIQNIVVVSDLYKQHPDWVVRGADGKPDIKKMGPEAEWMGDFGYLDASVDAARDYLYQVARKFRDTGFRYCFHDWAGTTVVPPSVSRKPEMTGVEVSRRALEAVRRGFGEDFYYLGQWMEAGFMGLVDSMRTGFDSFGWHPLAYNEALSKWFLNRRVMICDPDSWTPQMHELEWDRDWGSWQALSGYAMTLGIQTAKVEGAGPYQDWFLLTPGREELLRRVLPPLATPGRPRDIWERADMMPTVVEQALAAGGEQWRVVGLFNYRVTPEHVRLNLDRLWDESKFAEEGFPGDPARLGTTDRRYLVYDFWPEKFLGEFGGAADFDLEAMRGKVITVRLASARPQVLAVGNHIGQGVEELKKASWDTATKTLSLTTQGRRGLFNTAVRLRVPAGWKVLSAAAGKENLEWTSPQAEVCLFTLPDQKQAVTCKVKFAGPEEAVKPATRPVEPGLIADLHLDPSKGKQLRESLPSLWQKQLGERLKKEVPAGFELAFYAVFKGDRGELAGARYEPALGFGLANGWRDILTLRDQPERKTWTYLCWLDYSRIAYRIDALPSSGTYRVGVKLLDLSLPRGVHPPHLDLAVVRSRDGREFMLARKINISESFDPPVMWYELPTEAVDPAGLQIEVRFPDGHGSTAAACLEYWVVRRKGWFSRVFKTEEGR